MTIYLLRRLLLVVITLFMLSLLSFSVIYYKNVSDLSSLPLFEAYPRYLTQIFEGNLGASYINDESILSHLRKALPVTLELCALAVLTALCFGVPIGIIAGVYNKGVIDKIIKVFVLLGLSTPTFWLALLMVTFFSFYLDWLPVSGRYEPQNHVPFVTGFMYLDLFLSDVPNRGSVLLDMIRHSLLPVFTLAVGPMTEIIKLLRSSVIDVSKENYIKAAATRGLSRSKIIYRHVLHNAFPPIIPKLGLQFSTLLTLAMIIEIIFDWNGVGYWMMYSLYQQDYAVISAGVLVIGTLVIIAYIISEIISIISSPIKNKELYVLR